MRWEILLLLGVVIVCPLSMMWMSRRHRGHEGRGMSERGGMSGTHEPGDHPVVGDSRRITAGEAAPDSSLASHAHGFEAGDGRRIE